MSEEHSSGVRLGALSAVNKRLLILVGGVLMAIGVAGMVVVDLQAKEAIGNEDVWQAEGFWYEMKEYTFMFTIIAGFILVIYALLSIQREKAKRLGHTQ
ncbi:MAG TPA: hypothetical protein VIB07_00010 [Nitrososphaera sp.]|jgi:hypothetical protein